MRQMDGLGLEVNLIWGRLLGTDLRKNLLQSMILKAMFLLLKFTYLRKLLRILH